MKILKVNMVSESDISVQGHGVHTAYTELAAALERRDDIELTRGEFGKEIDCDIIHIHTVGTSVWKKLWQVGPKKVISAHVVPDSLVGSFVLAKYWRSIATLYMKWLYAQADLVLAVSAQVAGILEHELGLATDKIKILHNSIDTSQYTRQSDSRVKAREILGFKEDELIVVGNGQVQPRKRLDTFIALAKAHKDIRFIWVGGIPFKQLGAEYGKMKALMKKVPSNVQITGVIPHASVKHYLLAADIFCLPAEQENHPMCVIEAAAADLPIIVRDIREYDDTFADNVMRCSDDKSFVAAIEALRDASVRNKWRKQSRIIAKQFDSTTAAQKLVTIYRELV